MKEGTSRHWRIDSKLVANDPEKRARKMTPGVLKRKLGADHTKMCQPSQKGDAMLSACPHSLHMHHFLLPTKPVGNIGTLWCLPLHYSNWLSIDSFCFSLNRIKSQLAQFGSSHVLFVCTVPVAAKRGSIIGVGKKRSIWNVAPSQPTKILRKWPSNKGPRS